MTIRERPFYNTKRRSVYVDSANHFASINSGNSSQFGRPQLAPEWTEGGSSSRSRSMPKLDQLSFNGQQPSAGLYAVSNATPRSRSNSASSSEGHVDQGLGSASQLSTDYAYPRRRLYPSIPNRTFICVKPFKPQQPGEIELRKGDVVELFSVGDSGFWEGRCNGSAEGWFRADCVQEFSQPKDGPNDSILVKRKTLFDLITHNELNMPRTVVLQRGKKGFGFVLRGSKSKHFFSTLIK